MSNEEISSTQAAPEAATVSERIEENGQGLTIVAMETEQQRWQLIITDDDGNMTGWEDDFSNPQQAIAEGKASIAEQGLSFFIGEVDINALLADYEAQAASDTAADDSEQA
jgi:hypothetical protein